MNKKELIQSAIDNGFNVRSQFKHMTMEQLKEYTDKDRLHYSIGLLNITGDLNIGVAIRTALNMGAETVFILGNKKYDKRSTVGSHNYINIIKENIFYDSHSLKMDPTKLWNVIIRNGYYPVLVETDGKDIRNVSAKRFALKPCYIFGNEGSGIPEEIKQLDIVKLSLPQRGPLNSYNVSSSVAITLTYLYGDIL